MANVIETVPGAQVPGTSPGRTGSAPRLRRLAVPAALALAAALALTGYVAPPSGAAATVTDATTIAPPSQPDGAWVAKILRTTSARSRPGGTGKGWPVTTTVPGGSYAQELLVLDERTVDGRSWLKVRLPKRPNTADGWIVADATRLRHTGWWVRVRTRSRTVRVYRDGHLKMQFSAVVGAPSTPTPHGLFAVMLVARQADPHGFIGPWALHLTAHSDVLENYGGGPGRVAIHGRSGASLRDPLGTARSHGCVRVSNRTVSALARRLRAGTPVRISN